MSKLISIKHTLIILTILIFLNGCGLKNKTLNLQADKDKYCLNQIDLAYKNLEKGRLSPYLEKEDYFKNSFEIIKNANKNNCTSSHLFLAMHYKYGIGTNVDLKRSNYHLKLNEHYQLLPAEQRLLDQGKDLPSNNKE